MWVKEQANKSLKKEKNISLFYIIACTVTTLIMFTAINICNNEILVNSNEVLIEKMFYFFPGTPMEVIKKQNLLILLLIAVLFTAVCSFNFLRKKSKELAYLTLNGATIPDLIRFLIYQNGVILLISTVVGIILGIVLMPIFNSIVYIINGEWGSLITFSMDSIWLTLGFISIEVFAIVILNVGFLIRKEVKDLVDEEDLVIPPDKRQFKPKYFFLVLYLIPLLFAIISPTVENAGFLMIVLSYLSIPGSYGVMKYVIPKILMKLKKKKYMYDFKKLVYLSNAMDTIQKSLSFIFALQLSVTLFLSFFLDFQHYTGMKENLIFCVVGVSILISMTLIYTIFIEVVNNKGFYKQMKAFGYTNEELVELVGKELRVFFLLGVMVGVVQLLAVIIVYAISGLMSIGVAIVTICSLLLPLIIVNVGGEILAVKIVKENLDGGF
ncbi:MAG: FtsX-like permease family protein [Clostridium sp.]